MRPPFETVEEANSAERRKPLVFETASNPLSSCVHGEFGDQGATCARSRVLTRMPQRARDTAPARLQRVRSRRCYGAGVTGGVIQLPDCLDACLDGSNQD